MQKLTYAVALLIGATSAMKTNASFAAGVYGDEDLSNEIQELKKRQSDDSEFIQLESYQQSFAMAAAKAGSGVRARWIELPDCQKVLKEEEGSLELDSATHGEQIALNDDLSNAIIATCKGRTTAWAAPLPPTPNPVAGNPTPVERSRIFDPVWKTATTIPNTEHQVEQLQHGKVDMTEQTTGP